MTNWDEGADRATIEKIAGPLRAPVRLDDTFESRVMSEVHAESFALEVVPRSANRAVEKPSLPWWRKQYNIRVSPLRASAIAASLLVAIAGGSAIVGRALARSAEQTQAVSAAAKSGNSETVRFVFVDGSAKEVWIVGDFNAWTRKDTPLVRTANGNVWTVSIPLSNGRHEYAFIVRDQNGERWVADPLASTVRDDFGTESSVLRVGGSKHVI